MNRITASLAERSPNMNQGIGATVTPLKEAWVGPLRKVVVTLTLAALLLLLFACFDASLLLSRATEPEARRSPVRQLSVQGVLLSLLAAVLGLLLARWATRALLAVSGVGLPSFFHFAVGPSVLAAIVGLAVLSGLALGPASAPRGPRARRWRGAVVLLQVALALFLLIDTGMVARNFRRTIDRDLGLRAAGVLTFRMDLKGPQYMDNERVSKLLRERYLPRIAAVPGVRQVALSNPTMPTDALSGGYITIEDHASDSPDGTYIILWHSVSPGYFETLGIPILAGRGFNLGDTGSDAVVVSRAMADQHWPRQNPLGKRIKQDARGVTTEPWMTVVGVVGEVHHEGFRSQQPPAPDIYMSVLQFPLRLPLTINFLVRPEPGISAVALQAALHREMMRIDPEVPDYDVATLEERLARQTEKGRFEVLLTGIFAGLSLLLAGVGLFGIRGERSAGPVSRLAPRPLGIGER
jgi:hypothetical protein